MRILILMALASWLAAESAVELATDIIHTRAEAVRATQPALAAQLDRLAGGVAGQTISLADAQQVLALVSMLPPVSDRPFNAPETVASPPAPTAPAMPAESVAAVLDATSPAPVVATAPPPIVGSAAVITSQAPVPPAAPRTTPIGTVLAVQPGSDGRSALIAIGAGPANGVREGQRLAIRRDQVTLVLARVNQVKDDLTIALLIPGTWHNDQAEIRVGDEAAAIDE